MGILKKYSNRMVWLSMSMFAAFFVGCSSGDSSSTTTASTAVAPTVVVTTPDNNVTSVPTNRKISVTFSTPMNAATITTSTFTLSAGGVPVTGTVAYYNEKTAIFSPDANLTDSTVYTATITTGAKNVAGTALAANYVWHFTTGAVTTDTTNPDVNSTNPLANDVNVSINRTVTATFNEVMNPADINTTTFTLKTSTGGIPVAGTVTYLGTTASFNPTNDLNTSTDYNATVTTGVKDLAGNAMLVNKAWKFTTGTTAAAGPNPVNLGTAVNFAILTKTGIVDTPASVITGNIGSSPITGAAIGVTCPEVNGTIYQVDAAGVGACFATDPALLNTAVLNMQAAYTDAAGRTASSAATTNVGAGTLTSLTLTPGVYEWGSSVTIPTNLTFNGTASDVWILKVAGTLDMAAAKTVILTGGALAKNIFWQVSGAVTIGTTTQFKGIILGQTAITMGTGSTIEGRLLAQTAATLNQTTVTQPLP